MNNVPNLFNRKMLDRRLAAVAIEDIPDSEQKLSEMLKWKKSVDSSDLQKTKEKSVQGKFLTSVFEKVLGYATFLEGGEYNQIQEFTSKLDRTEADGALGFFTPETKQVRAVIELKDATTNLDQRQQRNNHQTPVEQAFGYAHKNGSSCGWVIVSNFIEIRLYKSSSSLEYEKITITDLGDEIEFKRFYTLLCKDNLIARDGKSEIDRLYNDNEQARAEISKEFYGKYKELRGNLFQALKEHNPQFNDEMALFRKAQKILDRFIFICFCENRLLLPHGIFKTAIEAGKKSLVRKPHRLWEQLCGLFDSIDQGNPPMNINGYNGGLFKSDPVLDAFAVPDTPLERFAEISDYDFGSDLNVNILGHIFEQSISDLEQFKAEIKGTSVERKRSKQKADGIYYTPNYVTEYIVKQTIGRWLADRRGEIGFDNLPELNDVDYNSVKMTGVKGKGQSISYNKNIARHVKAWEAYRESLLNIRILDPACGSGAFLNEAFDYLKSEGQTVDNELSRLHKGQSPNFIWDTHILTNNIFGVDLNRESVDITKLSLWLKTASKHEKLINLDDNIKAGNSLINDTVIAGDLAFDWRREFQEIMSSGGFDIVIGNPPYGALLSQAEKDYMAANYETTEYNFDTYKTFMELGLKLTKQNGYLGYITPNTYFVLEKGANKLRKFLFENFTLLNIVELFNVFPAAVVEPAISIYKKSQPRDNDQLEVISVPRKTDLISNFMNDGIKTTFTQKDLKEKDGYIFNFRETEIEKRIIEKIRAIARPLSELFLVSAGVKPYEKGKGAPPQTQEIVDNKPFESYEKKDDTWIPYIRGKNIERYTDKWNGEYIKYGEWLAAPRNPDMFKNEKLFVRRTDDYLIATHDATGKIGNNSIHCIYPIDKNTTSLKYLLGIVNSKFMRWFFRHENFHMVDKPFAEIKVIFVERFPIVIAPDQQPVIALVDKLLENCQARFDKSRRFVKYLDEIYNPKTISERLFEFYKLSFKEFVDELKKQSIKFTPKQEMELMPLFEEKSGEIQNLSRTIDALDAELDNMVYAVYGLTPEETAIVEGGAI